MDCKETIEAGPSGKAGSGSGNNTGRGQEETTERVEYPTGNIPEDQSEDFYDQPICPCEMDEPEALKDYEVSGERISYNGDKHTEVYQNAALRAENEFRSQLASDAKDCPCCEARQSEEFVVMSEPVAEPSVPVQEQGMQEEEGMQEEAAALEVPLLCGLASAESDKKNGNADSSAVIEEREAMQVFREAFLVVEKAEAELIMADIIVELVKNNDGRLL